MLALLIDPAENVVRVTEPAISTLAQTVIGALLILSWVIALLALWQLNKVQNQRTEDQKHSSAKEEDLVTKMTEVLSGVKVAVEGLRATEEQSQQVLGQLKQSFDFFVFSQIRENSPPRGIPAQPTAVPKEDKP